MASCEHEKKTCSELLLNLKKGQRDLKRSLRKLENDAAAKQRRMQRTRRHLAEKPINRARDLPRKRARIELLSPSTEMKGTSKHPRRFSSTPKKCDKPLVPFSAPEVDSSLEEAILDLPPTHTNAHSQHLPSPKMSQVAVDTSRNLRESTLSQSFLHSSAHKKCKESSKRGLSVSFVDRPDTRPSETPTTQKTVSDQEKGKSLVSSLNASRHGALDRTLSGKKKRFPRRYAGDDPKLGYDWIAGLIDASDTYLSERDDQYFEELKEFRRVNCSECYKPRGGPLPDSAGAPASMHPPPVDGESKLGDSGNLNSTTCVRSYLLNDRLFPIPRHMTSDLVRERGGGVLEASCPVCEDKYSDSQSPVRYIRVSVPKRTLQSSYHLRPHRRKSFDPTDSMGLSKHCLAGWETAQPSVVPSQPSVGLKAATGQEKPLSSSDLLNTSHTVEYNLRSRTVK